MSLMRSDTLDTRAAVRARHLAGGRFTLRAAGNRTPLWSGMIFRPDGAVDGVAHPAFRRWVIERGHLFILADNAVPSCHFRLDEADDEPAVMTGRFLLEPKDMVLWLESERFVDLTALANRFGTDKGTAAGDRHGYTEVYATFFEPLRLERFALLEVGLLICNLESELDPRIRSPDVMPSMDMWLSYFPHADCYGFDLSDFSAAARTRERFTFIHGDLSRDDDLRRLAGSVPRPRVIIDDASHAAFHQQRTFMHLFPALAAGGFYVIEDLHYSPPFETALPPCRRMWHVLRQLLDDKRLELDFGTAAENAALAAEIGNVFVHCSARGPDVWGPKMVIVQKKGGGWSGR